jgi:hypothetical protein
VLKDVVKRLLGALVLMQLIIYMAILSSEFPGNVVFFMSQVKPIVSFDLLKFLGEINKYIFHFDEAN